MEAWHLTKRFFSSLVPRAPSPAEEAWLVALLTPAEEVLYRAQPDLDRCHSISCALALQDELGAGATRNVLVAGALHDVGKAEVGFGTLARVGATTCAKLFPAATVEGWATNAGRLGRVGRYAKHDERGAELLMEAGSHPMVVAWAREHHCGPERWSIELETASALARCDG